MKTSLTTFISSMLICSAGIAQDVMTLKNGNELKVKVLEVAPTEIKYKKFDNLDGPTYTDLKANIFMIKYESGIKDVFAQESATPANVVADNKSEDKKPLVYRPNANDIYPYNNNDLIVTIKGDSIKCVIDEVTRTAIAFHILKSGMDSRLSIPTTSVANYYNNSSNQTQAQQPSTGPLYIPQPIQQPVSAGTTSTTDDDEFLPEVRKYGGPRVGATFVMPGKFYDMLKAEGKNNVFSQFGWQVEKRLFTTKTGISAMVEFVPLIGGIDMGKFIPSMSGLLAIRIKNGAEFGVGPNVSVYGYKDVRGDFNTATTVGIVIAGGMSFKSDKVYFPVNIAFVPSVGKKANYTDPSTGKTVSVKYETGAKISLLVGFNYRKR
jgi:hypothetical protein